MIIADFLKYLNSNDRIWIATIRHNVQLSDMNVKSYFYLIILKEKLEIWSPGKQIVSYIHYIKIPLCMNILYVYTIYIYIYVCIYIYTYIIHI